MLDHGRYIYVNYIKYLRKFSQRVFVVLLLGLGARMATLYAVQTTGILHAELTLDEAAGMLGIDPLELEWAIEEDGISSTIDDQGKYIVAVAAGDEWRLK